MHQLNFYFLPFTRSIIRDKMPFTTNHIAVIVFDSTQCRHRMGWTGTLKRLITVLYLFIAAQLTCDVTNADKAPDFIGVGYNILTSNFDYEDSSSLQYNKRILAPDTNQISSAVIADQCIKENTFSHVFEGTLSYQSKILKSVHLSGNYI